MELFGYVHVLLRTLKVRVSWDLTQHRLVHKLSTKPYGFISSKTVATAF